MKFSLLFALLNLFFIPYAFAADSLSFSQSWIAEAPPGAQVMAGYMTINNLSNQKVDIIQVESPQFKRIEMHQSKESNGLAQMQPQKKLSITAKSKLILKSGSYHLMLIEPIKWFKQGDKITLTFTLSDQTQAILNTSVRKAGLPAMKCGANKCGTM